jgi:hypothetical protein
MQEEKQMKQTNRKDIEEMNLQDFLNFYPFKPSSYGPLVICRTIFHQLSLQKIYKNWISNVLG